MVATRKVDPAPARGRIIKAQFLQQLQSGVNATIDAVRKPGARTKERSTEPDGSAATGADIVFEETGRKTSEIDVNGVTISRIEEVTFINDDGVTMMLKFDNPESE